MGSNYRKTIVSVESGHGRRGGAGSSMSTAVLSTTYNL